MAFFLSVTVPGLFLAFITYHFEFLPEAFAQTISRSRQGVPFSGLAECILLCLTFEILRETGVRMPQSVGHALSIVGGLVVGQSAVEAKIISAPILIAVALAGICGLMVPRLRAAVFYLRFGFIFAAALLGVFGILLLWSVVIIHILGLKSLGASATLSLNTPTFQGLKDVFIRANWTKMITRPKIQTKNKYRKTL